MSVTGGAGNDNLSFEDLKMSGKLSINTGAGNDTINIERAPVPGMPSLFAGPINVNAGAGNDSVGIGILAMSQIIAFSKVQLIGGSGSDTLSFAANGNVLFAGSSASGFETG